MHTILTIQEAFAAKQAGKNVVCRHAESEFYEDLKNVSAETWFDPHYVFALKIETIVLGTYEFTKPYTLDELALNDDVYYVGASGTILKGKFNPENEMLVSAVKNGSVQRDEENAILQMNAFRSLLNIEAELPEIVDYDFFVVEGAAPKPEPKKRGGRKKKESTTTLPSSNEEIINSAQSIDELNEIKATFNEANVELYEMIGKKEDSLNDQSVFNVSQTNEPQTKEDTAAIVQDYIAQLDECMTEDDVMQVRYTLSSDNRLEREQVLHLNECGEKRMASIDNASETKNTSSKPKYTIPPLTTGFLDQILAAKTVEELTVISDEINQVQNDHPHSAGAYKFLLVEIEAKKEQLNQLDLMDGTQDSSMNIVDRIDLTNSIADLDILEEGLTPEQKNQYQWSLGNKRQALEKLSSIPTSDEMKNLSKVRYDQYETKISEANNLVTLSAIEREINDDRHLDSIQKTELLKPLKIKRADIHNNFVYEKKLSELTTQVQQAQTIDEANEPVSQTLDWTTEQRLPLITAISKRLVELGKPLIAQIRETNDLNTLDVYLKQVHELIAVDGTLAHQCMQAYTVRKSALSLASPA